MLGNVAAIRAKISEVKLNCKAARMSHVYRRFDPNRPAYTLTGSDGGVTPVYHWREHRAPTNAERAILHTFAHVDCRSVDPDPSLVFSRVNCLAELPLET